MLPSQSGEIAAADSHHISSMPMCLSVKLNVTDQLQNAFLYPLSSSVPETDPEVERANPVVMCHADASKVNDGAEDLDEILLLHVE